jgi:hypothetical protein
VRQVNNLKKVALVAAAVRTQLVVVLVALVVAQVGLVLTGVATLAVRQLLGRVTLAGVAVNGLLKLAVVAAAKAVQVLAAVGLVISEASGALGATPLT